MLEAEYRSDAEIEKGRQILAAERWVHTKNIIEKDLEEYKIEQQKKEASPTLEAGVEEPKQAEEREAKTKKKKRKTTSKKTPRKANKKPKKIKRK